MTHPAPILVATDLSPGADDGIREGDRRARALGAPLVVCMALPDPQPSAPLFPTVHQSVDLALPAWREQLMVAVGTRVEELTGRPPSEVEIDILIGTPHVEIVELADRLAPQLLVIGSRGTSGLTHALLGSVAERVVRHAHCPVLVARPAPRTGRVLVATDFSKAAEAAVAAAVGEARRDGSSLTIFHCVELMPVPVTLDAGMTLGFPSDGGPDVLEGLEREARGRLVASLAEQGAVGEVVVRHGPSIAAILDTAQVSGASLIVVGTLGRTGVERFLLGSVAAAVVRQAPCSVLVVRNRG